MKKIDNNIFSYLSNKYVYLSEKEKLITKKKNKIIKLINKLDPQQLVDYLLDYNLPKLLKKIISDEINKLENSNTEESKKRIEDIKKYIVKKKIKSESFLDKDYYPNLLKNIIIDKNYNKNIFEVLHDKSIPLKVKKSIIDLKCEEENIAKLLKENLPLEIIDYIIETKVITPDTIKSVLHSNASTNIKEQVISTKITGDNLVAVLSTNLYSDQIIKKIFELRKYVIVDYIRSIKNRELIKTMSSHKMKAPLIEKIMEVRREDVETQLKKLNKNNIGDIIFESNSGEFTKLIIEKKRDTVLKSIYIISPHYLLWLLNNEYIPLDIKEYIIKKRKKDIDNQIKQLNTTGVKLYYLNRDGHLPLSIQNRMFELTKHLFKEEMQSYNQKELIEAILYGTSSNILKKYLIEEGINIDNIFYFLEKLDYHFDLASFTITLKKDIIADFLNKLPSEKIFTLFENRINAKIRNLIIEQNKDIVSKKLDDYDDKELIETLVNVDTLFEIKKLILERFNIYDDNLVNCLQMINYDNCELLVSNYHKIKTFFQVVGINFDTFIQYGSGSKKYSDWFINIIDIINSQRAQEFINVKNYFFTNYYNTDNEKENNIHIIDNFLELLENFSKNYELCLNLEKQNKKLNRQDKLNITFLFNCKNLENLNMPKTLEELNKFKLNLYYNYIKLLDEEDTSILELKEIFKDAIFYGADEILENIGGTLGLKTLKKNNFNSKYICSLVDDLLIYANIIEKVNITNSKDGLIKSLKYIFEGDLSNLTSIQNIFLEFKSKVLKLYELDSQFNLTHLANIKNLDGVINKELSLKYGGEVLDFSDKNYVLYGHTLSYRENIEDLVNGVSSGKRNFISVSPISYMGQKYYYNTKDLIIAFGRIPTGSFVCSSIYNMGSNYSINKNSSEVREINRHQRGILETSAVTENNSEALLYREGLKACGIILPGGKKPNEKELEYHLKYNLPFIITQDIGKAIDNPKNIFNNIDDRIYESESLKELKHIQELLETKLVINKETDEYTGREIALFADCHSMYEPTIAVLEDIRKRGIIEIYSLGDNVGFGPNPAEVFDLLEDYNVKSVAGNSEYYNILGTEPYIYFYPEKIRSQEWTYDKLGTSRIDKLKLYPASIELLVGNKNVALCHFANDIRWDYVDNSTWTYQKDFEPGISSKQFLYTNSDTARKVIEEGIARYNGDSRANGFISAQKEPIFQGKKITDYDSVFQGHVHFEMTDRLKNTDIYTLRAIGMGYSSKSDDKACYYILKERKDGSFDIEKILVEYNKNHLISNVQTCDIPEKEKVLRFLKGK